MTAFSPSYGIFRCRNSGIFQVLPGFKLDDSKSLHGKCLEITISIHLKLVGFGVPGMNIRVLGGFLLTTHVNHVVFLPPNSKPQLSGHEHRARYEMDKNNPDESTSDESKSDDKSHDKSDDSKSHDKSDESKSDEGKSDESTETDGEKGGRHRPGWSKCCLFCIARVINGEMAMCQNYCRYQSNRNN